MRHALPILLAVLAFAPAATPVASQEPRPEPAPIVALLDVDESSMNMDRPVFFRLAVSRDANVAVFHVSEAGRLRVVFPASADHRARVQAGDTLELSVGGYRERWLARHAGQIGVAGNIGSMPRLPFVFAIATDRPLDLSRFGASGTWRYQYVVDRMQGIERVVNEVVAATIGEGALDEEYTVDAFDYGAYQQMQMQQAYSTLAACGVPMTTLFALQGLYPWGSSLYANGLGLGGVGMRSLPWFGQAVAASVGFSPFLALGSGGVFAQCGFGPPFLNGGRLAMARPNTPVGPGTRGKRPVEGGPKDSVARRKLDGFDGGPKDPTTPLDRVKVARGLDRAPAGERAGKTLAGPTLRREPAAGRKSAASAGALPTKWRREESPAARRGVRYYPGWNQPVVGSRGGWDERRSAPSPTWDGGSGGKATRANSGGGASSGRAQPARGSSGGKSMGSGGSAAPVGGKSGGKKSP